MPSFDLPSCFDFCNAFAHAAEVCAVIVSSVHFHLTKPSGQCTLMDNTEPTYIDPADASDR